jgi:Domain of unknown function (DUF4383)
MSAKECALWGGVILLVLGVIGLFTGNSLIGLNSEMLEDVIHIVAGAILAYFGWRGAPAQASMWLKVFGVIFLVVGLLGFFDRSIFGLFTVGMGTFDNIVHLLYGIGGIYFGWKAPA